MKPNGDADCWINRLNWEFIPNRTAEDQSANPNPERIGQKRRKLKIGLSSEYSIIRAEPIFKLICNRRLPNKSLERGLVVFREASRIRQRSEIFVQKLVPSIMKRVRCNSAIFESRGEFALSIWPAVSQIRYCSGKESHF